MTSPLPRMTDAELDRPDWTPDDHTGFGTLETAQGHLPLKALEVETRITGLVARTTVRQTFVNTYDSPLEATYIFPLPDQAAVSQFRLRVVNRVVEGVLKERGEARREYNQAIAAGHRAAIAEEERPDVFTMRVGNIPRGESATVELTMTAPVLFIEGEATYRFPLVVAPRYMPGRPLSGGAVGSGTATDTDRTPDASRISPPVLLPGYPNPVQLAIRVGIDTGGLPLGEPRCSLHAIMSERTDTQAYVEIQPGERVNRDFILRFNVAGDMLRTSCVAVPDAPGAQEGTFQLSLISPRSITASQRPRDVIFVLDRSGSMGGWKMAASRRAVARMVDTLSDADRFNIYAFDTYVETVPKFDPQGMAHATNRNRYHAIEFLATVDARGGTAMSEPLTRGAQVLTGAKDPNRDRVMVLVTDGQVGNEDDILRRLKPHSQDITVFTIGIDRDVNAGFLNRLATFGGGACELVEGEARLDEVMERIHRLIDTPVLTDLDLSVEGADLIPGSVVPARLPGLFAGQPVILFGRYRGAPEGHAVVKGQQPGGRGWTARVPFTAHTTEAIGQLWARKHLRDLEDQYVTAYSSAKAELERQILEVSLRHNVLCRFTAFVAVDREERIDRKEDEELRKVTQAVEAPDGWSMMGTDGPEGGESMPDPEPFAKMSLEEATGARFDSFSVDADDDEMEEMELSASFDAFGMSGMSATNAPAPAPFSVSDSAGFGGAPGGGNFGGMPPSAPMPMAPGAPPMPSPAAPPMESLAPPMSPRSAATPPRQSAGRKKSKPGRSMMERARGFFSPARDEAPAPVELSKREEKPTSMDQSRTQAGSIRGTIRNMSPQLVQGASATPADDVFALGCVLFELVTGQPLFPGSSFEALAKIMSGDRANLALLTNRAAGLRGIIERATAHEPHERQSSPAVLGAELNAWVVGALTEPMLFEVFRDAMRPMTGAGATPLPAALASAYRDAQQVMGGVREAWLAKDASGSSVLIIVMEHLMGHSERFHDFARDLGLPDGVWPQRDAGTLADGRPFLVLDSHAFVPLSALRGLYPDAAAKLVASAALRLEHFATRGTAHGLLDLDAIVMTDQGFVIIQRPDAILTRGGDAVDVAMKSELLALKLQPQTAPLPTINPVYRPDMAPPKPPTTTPAHPAEKPKGFLQRMASFFGGNDDAEPPKTPDASSGAEGGAEEDFWK